MKCSEVREEFIGYIDGDISDETRLGVEVHVAECYRCREELDELGRLLDISGAALKHPCPADRFDDLRSRLTPVEPAFNPAPRRRKPRTRELLFKLAVAAIIIAMIAASPLLIKGVKRLFAPVGGTAELGSSAGVSLPFVEQRLKLQEELDDALTTGRDDEQATPYPPTR